MFAQRELGSREVCNREHRPATSDQEVVYPVILKFLAEIKRALVSLTGKQPITFHIWVRLAQVSKCASIYA